MQEEVPKVKQELARAGVDVVTAQQARFRQGEARGHSKDLRAVLAAAHKSKLAQEVHNSTELGAHVQRLRSNGTE